MTGNIDMGGHSITGLKVGSSGDTSALSAKSIDSWGLQFLKRDGGTLASNLDVNNYELTKVGNPTTDGSAVNKRWATDEFMSSRGGLVKGDLDMGDSSGILDLKDPVNDKDAVNKQWVEKNFLKTSTGLTQSTADTRYVRKLRHIYAEWVWGYRGVAVAATRYYAFCQDQIPPSWRTDPINNMTDLNLESINIKSDAPLFSTVLNIPIGLILWATVWEKQSNGKFTQVKKEIVLATIDLRRLSYTWFNGTFTTTGGSTACYVFKGNSMFYLGNEAELVDNTLAWCVIVKPEHSMPIGMSMDMSFCWSLRYSGSGS